MAHITGQELEVRTVSEGVSRTIVEQELEALRAKYEELSDEVRSDDILISLANLNQRTELRNKLNQQIAEMNTLKSLPLNIPVPNAKASGKGGPEVRVVTLSFIQSHDLLRTSADWSSVWSRRRSKCSNSKLKLIASRIQVKPEKLYVTLCCVCVRVV